MGSSPGRCSPRNVNSEKAVKWQRKMSNGVCDVRVCVCGDRHVEDRNIVRQQKQMPDASVRCSVRACTCSQCDANIDDYSLAVCIWTKKECIRVYASEWARQKPGWVPHQVYEDYAPTLSHSLSLHAGVHNFGYL